LGGGFILPVGKKLRIKHERGNLSKIATSIPFSIIRKKVLNREFRSLLFGQAGLLDVEKKIIILKI
jgi:hypothetical protein